MTYKELEKLAKELEELANVRLGVIKEQSGRLQQVANAYRTGNNDELIEAARLISLLYPPMQEVSE
jgi:hypothetical protein